LPLAPKCLGYKEEVRKEEMRKEVRKEVRKDVRNDVQLKKWEVVGQVADWKGEEREDGVKERKLY
jgi:hypothetical protein